MNWRFLLSTRKFDAALVVVAVTTLAVVLVPVRFWHHPTTDAVYSGFDPNFVYMNLRGDGSADGAIAMSSQSVTLKAPPGSQPTIDLVTSPLSFGASMDVKVLAPGPNVGYLSLGLWTPETASGYFLFFGPSPNNLVFTEVITDGATSKTLVGGKILSAVTLGKYIPGQRYHVSMDLDKKAARITTSIAAVDPTPVFGDQSSPLAADTVVDATQFPQLFRGLRPTLSLSLTSGGGVPSAAVSNYKLILPSQPDSVAELVEKVDDWRARFLTVLLTMFGAGLIAFAAGPRGLQGLRSAIRHLKQYASRESSTVERFRKPAVFSVAAAGYLLLNSILFRLGSPHYDVYAPKIWSYLAAHNGFIELYHQTFLIPAAAVEGGFPLHDAAFPYGPTKAYFYLVVGWLYRLTLAPPGLATTNTYQLDFLLRSLNVTFALVDAFLVFAILRRAGAKISGAWLAVAVFILNPALMFVMSVWGSTETVSLSFMLLSIWFAQKQKATLAWTALALGSFTRPQMLVFAFLLGCAYLRRFAIMDNARAISWTVIVLFIVMSPLSLAISPSFPVDYISHIIGFQVAARAADPSTLAISPALYSVWTLPMLYVNGQHGFERMWHARSTDLFASVTYGQASSLLTIGLLVAVGIVLVVRRSDYSFGRQLPLVAFGMFGWLMLGDSLISRYLLYGLVVVILSSQSFRSPLFLWCVGWLTFVIVVCSWCQLALDVPASAPINAQNNVATRALLSLFANDRFITTGTIANLIVLLLLGIAAIKGNPPQVEPEERSSVMGGPVRSELKAIGEPVAT